MIMIRCRGYCNLIGIIAGTLMDITNKTRNLGDIMNKKLTFAVDALLKTTLVKLPLRVLFIKINTSKKLRAALMVGCDYFGLKNWA